MKNTSLINLVIFSIILNNASCVIWKNFLLDSMKILDPKFKSTNQKEKYLNATELAQFYGYSIEEHSVQTDDGYLLTMQRIALRASHITGYGAPVLLMHGLVNSGPDWMTLGKGNALALLCADAGYDVWLGNARGSKYSLGHVTLSTKQQQYWNFTFHEIGIFDLPAMIDYTLQKNGRTQLTFVGHSQGTTAFFIMTSLRTEYNKKVNLMVALAPIAWTGNLRSPIPRFLAPIRDLMQSILNAIGVYDFLPSNLFTRFIFQDVCSSSKLALMACETVLFTLYGFDFGQIQVSQATVELAQFPSGASLKQVVHYLQLVQSHRFRQYDYGPDGNNVMYGSIVPPDYPVGNITTPMALFIALNDLLSDLKDVNIFLNNCLSVEEVHQVAWKRFNHMDHLWARDAKKLVYLHVLKLIKSYL